MVDDDKVEELEMKCRGGEHCCVRNDVKMCGLGEGDCNHDHDCDGALVCGSNNCNKQGGLWDLNDDCCQHRCSAQSPCKGLIN